MSKENKIEKAIAELSASIGKDKISVDKPTRVCYSITHGSEFLFHEDYFGDFLPDAVVRPSCTNEVQEIVKIANAYKVPLVPSGGRSGSCGAEGIPGGIVVDMCGMDKILELNERDYRVTAEAGIRKAVAPMDSRVRGNDGMGRIGFARKRE